MMRSKLGILKLTMSLDAKLSDVKFFSFSHQDLGYKSTVRLWKRRLMLV